MLFWPVTILVNEAKSGSLSKSFIRANPFTTKHMCLKLGPESLQSAYVFYPHNFYLMRICRITSACRREGCIEENKRHNPLYQEFSSIPRCWEGVYEEQHLLEISSHNTYSMLKFILLMCGSTYSDLLNQIFNLLYRPLAWMSNVILSDIAWTLQSLKVFQFLCLDSLSLKTPLLLT